MSKNKYLNEFGFQTFYTNINVCGFNSLKILQRLWKKLLTSALRYAKRGKKFFRKNKLLKYFDNKKTTTMNNFQYGTTRMAGTCGSGVIIEGQTRVLYSLL